MPYLNSHNQKRLEDIVTQIVMTDLKNPGDLNYLFCKLALRYLKCLGECYQSYNDIEGALQCASKEFYLRQTLQYEEKKCETNGDVF